MIPQAISTQELLTRFVKQVKKESQILDQLLQLESPGSRKITEVDHNPLSKRTKIRTTYDPNTNLRRIHDYILNEVKQAFKKSIVSTPCAHGWSKGNSPKKNILSHKRGNVFPRYWFVTDIKDAFAHVEIIPLIASVDMIFGGELWTLRRFLEKYCMRLDGGLAQGYPASPYLFNLYAHTNLDCELRHIAHRCGARYSRLGDDLIFTSEEPITHAMRQNFLHCITRAKLPVNHRKTFLYDLKKVKNIQLNGIGIRNRIFKHKKFKGKHGELPLYYAKEEAEIFCPGHFKRKIKGLLTTAIFGNKKISKEVVHGNMGMYRAQTGMYHSALDKEIEQLYTKYKKLIKN